MSNGGQTQHLPSDVLVPIFLRGPGEYFFAFAFCHIGSRTPFTRRARISAPRHGPPRVPPIAYIWHTPVRLIDILRVEK